MSDVVVIGRGRLNGERSTWWPTVRDDGIKAARVYCPSCGLGLAVKDVGATGIVDGPVLCGACGWVATVILGSWGRR